jgi:hypothetical protein
MSERARRGERGRKDTARGLRKKTGKNPPGEKWKKEEVNK